MTNKAAKRRKIILIKGLECFLGGDL